MRESGDRHPKYGGKNLRVQISQLEQIVLHVGQKCEGRPDLGGKGGHKILDRKANR